MGDNVAKQSDLEFIDFNGEVIVLTNYYYKHIIDRHGSEMTKYHKNWEETLKMPDFSGESKRTDGCKTYIQQNNAKRNYLPNIWLLL